MSNKKKLIIIIGILLLYLIIMILIFGVDRVKNKFYHMDVLIEPGTYLKYENGIWKDVKEIDKMLGLSYQVYGDHKFLYEASLQHTQNKWYAFDRNSNFLSLPDHFFAHRGNITVKVANDYSSDVITSGEQKEVEQILKENEVNYDEKYTKIEKIEYDLNNDGKKESIYIVSNFSYIEEELEKDRNIFSFVYVKSNKKTQILIEEVSKYITEVPGVSLVEILDYNNDQKYELIFKQTYYDRIGTCHGIFQYEKDTYKSVKDCEIIEREDESNEV